MNTIVYLVASVIVAQTPLEKDAVLSAAGPRVGPVYVIEVHFNARRDLDALDAQGYNISHFFPPNRAVVYATPREYKQLLDQGYSVDVLEVQPTGRPSKQLGLYHTYDTLSDQLQAFADAYPSLTRLVTLGQSVQGRELWAILITDNPNIEEDEPEFKGVGTMHGDEPVGTEMWLYLIDRMLTDYGTDARITRLLDETAIWILPLMNPDGNQMGTRANANGFDLNRSFPIYPQNFVATYCDGEPPDSEGRQPEVRHVMNWTVENAFALSANTHGGALVVNYPYDQEIGVASGSNAPTPDDALFRNLSLRYSTLNPPMFASFLFPDGITNGSRWFSILGGMQDWNYRYAGCLDVTLEISAIKRPGESRLAQFWQDNEESLLAYIEAVHIGVRGLVTDRVDGIPVWAKVTVGNNPQPVFTDADVGDYHRLLLPGTYSVTVSAPGYIAWTEPSVIVEAGDATRFDVPLSNGDVNVDAIVNAADVQLVINALLGLAPSDGLDVDGGGVSSTDLQAVVNVALGIPLTG